MTKRPAVPSRAPGHSQLQLGRLAANEGRAERSLARSLPDRVSRSAHRTATALARLRDRQSHFSSRMFRALVLVTPNHECVFSKGNENHTGTAIRTRRRGPKPLPPAGFPATRTPTAHIPQNGAEPVKAAQFARRSISCELSSLLVPGGAPPPDGAIWAASWRGPPIQVSCALAVLRAGGGCDCKPMCTACRV